MNNHNRHNNEQRQDENPSGHILKRVLPHREDESIGTARYRSTTPTYQITIEHGSIRIGQEYAASPQAIVASTLITRR